MAVRFVSAVLIAAALAAPAFAADAPACDDPDLGNYVKSLAAGITVKGAAAPEDQAVLGELAGSLTLSDYAEDSYDPATLTRVCYANIVSTAVADFEGGGLVYTIVGAPGTPEGVKVNLDVVPKR